MRSLPYEPWLTLVMIDGQVSVGDLARGKPELPDVIPSLERLYRDGYVEPLVAPDAPLTDPESPKLAAQSIERAGQPRPRRSGGGQPWFKRALFSFPLILIAALALASVQALRGFENRVEELLTKLGGATSIGETSYSFAPWPVLRLAQVVVGESMRASEVLVRPSIAALLQGPPRIAEARLQTVTLAGHDLAALLAGVNDGTSEWIAIENIFLRNAKVSLGGLTFGPFDAQIKHSADGKLERAVFSMDEQRSRLEVKPHADGLSVDLAAKSWSTPTQPALRFERLDASGLLKGETLVLDRVEGVLQDGVVKGSLGADWQSSIAIEGRFTATNVDLQSLLARFTRGFSVGGRLSAEGKFVARANTLPRLFDDLDLDGSFLVTSGVLYNADMATATREGKRGGATQFEELTGNVRIADRSLAFRQLRLSSGLVSAQGNLDISPTQQLAGRFTVNLRAQGQPGAIVSIGGSLKEPVLRPGG